MPSNSIRHGANSDDIEDLDEPLDPDIERAIEWLVTLHSGDVTADEWDAYVAWKAFSPKRQSAGEAAERLWAAIGPAARPPKARQLGKASVAVILGLGLLTGLFAGGAFGPPAALMADHRTATGERRTVTLADESRLDLDADTSVDVVFEEGRRRLILHKGRLHVAVSPDRNRPFEVEAAGGVIRALGTAFDVRRDGERVRVAVTEHAVGVNYPSGGEGGATRVSVGEQVSFGPAEGLGRPTAAKLHELTGWQRGRLIFDGRPLGEVVDEMGRYRPGLVIVTDERLRAMPVTGVFDTVDSEGLLDAVAEVLPVKVRALPWIAVIQPDPLRERNSAR